MSSIFATLFLVLQLIIRSLFVEQISMWFCKYDGDMISSCYLLDLTGKSPWMKMVGLSVPVGVVIKNIALGSGDRGIYSQAEQIGQSVTNGPPPPEPFLGTVLPDTQVLSRGDGSCRSFNTSA